MKVRWLIILAALAILLLIASPATAQLDQYSIDWFTVDSGGGTSIGGEFTLNGTIGQPDAGTLTGGEYELSGGFWNQQALLYRTYMPILERSP